MKKLTRIPKPRRTMRALLCVFLSAAFASAEEARLVILHINDTHGQTTTKRDGEYPAARIARHVASQREQHPGAVLFLHAGDEFSRGDALTRATLGASSFAVFDAMGLDAFTPGNGEFYDGAQNLLDLAAGVKFHVLHANTKPADPSVAWLPATTVVERAGVKIGIVGGGVLTKQEGSPKLETTPFNDVVKPLAAALTNNTDFVIALSHSGVMDDYVLARAETGIDLIVGGHTHTVLPAPVRVSRVVGGVTNSTWVVQAGDDGKFVGRVEVVLERADETARYSVKSITGGLDAMGPETPADDAVTALIEAWQEKQSNKKGGVQ